MPRWKEGTPEAVMKLWEWQYAGATHFTASLFMLIAKADTNNALKLRRVYPEEVDAFRRWHLSANPETFFQQFFEPEPEPKDPEWLKSS